MWQVHTDKVCVTHSLILMWQVYIRRKLCYTFTLTYRATSFDSSKYFIKNRTRNDMWYIRTKLFIVKHRVTFFGHLNIRCVKYHIIKRTRNDMWQVCTNKVVYYIHYKILGNSLRSISKVLKVSNNEQN